MTDSAPPRGERPVREPGVLCLRNKVFEPGQFAVMAVVNRTPDSFHRPGETWDESVALAYVDEAVVAGADILDIGGVPARPPGPTGQVDVAEEIRRTASFIAAVRSAHPDVVISIDTWRHEVAREACAAGADLVNDSWGGWDERMVDVAAEAGAGYVCTHVGVLTPRTRPFRVTFEDVMADVLDHTLALAERARAAGVDESRILIDPAHDFGKNTWHSLEITRRIGEMVATGWPVLVSLSEKDFIGETLGLAKPEDRMIGTLAATSVCAWHGVRVFRAHHVRETIETLKTIATIRGDSPPERTVRGLV